MQKIAKIVGAFCFLGIVVPMLLVVLQELDPEVGIVVTVIAGSIALLMLAIVLQPANLIAKLTQQDRYILAIEFVELRREAFTLPPGQHGRWGYLSLEEVRGRVSRMVDIGVLRSNSSGAYELTRDGKATIRHISLDEARPPH